MTMTNNPTIDGVSRELLVQAYFELDAGTASIATLAGLKALIDAPAVEPPNALREHCKQCADVVKTWPEWKQNCLGGAPAVERQTDSDCEWCGGAGHDHYGDPCTACTQVEVAALQSTIAQLHARVQELESGRGEPVAWLDLEKVSHGMAYATNAKINDRQTALYTAPPSPVAVKLDEQQAFSGWTHEIVEFEHSDVTRKIQRRDMMDVRDEKSAWAGWQARACLDATAALIKSP